VYKKACAPNARALAFLCAGPGSAAFIVPNSAACSPGGGKLLISAYFAFLNLP
jgi:hypothetical protein